MPYVSQPATLARNTVVSRSQSIAIALATLAVLVVWFANIGYRTLSEPDEGRYAEIPREMLATGDWITPRLNGIPYLEKPPLQYWSTAIAYSAFGMKPWVSRLWTATLGLLGIVATFLTARELWNVRVGQLAAPILASCPLYFVVAHLNTLDIGLSFFMNAGLSCFMLAQRSSSDTLRRRWMWACWLALACGFLQKGLVALVLPAVTLAIYSLVYRDRQLRRQLHPGTGLLIVAAVCLPWLILVSTRNPGFMQFFFVHEHLARFATTIHKRSEPWWYFIAILSVGVLPWIWVMLRSVFTRAPATDSHSRLNETGLLLTWIATLLVFFSMSGSKLAPYIVPAAPPLALLAARWLDVNATAKTLRPVVILAALLSLLLVFLKLLVPHVMEPGLKQAAYLQLGNWTLVGGAFGIAGAIAAVIAMRRLQWRAATFFMASGFTVALAIVMCGTNALGVLRSRPGVAAEIAPHVGANTAFYCVGMYWQALPFELRKTCKLVQYTGEHELQFDPQRRQWLPELADFLREWQQQPDAVAIVSPEFWPYVEAAGVPARTLLRAHDVTVIVKP